MKKKTLVSQRLRLATVISFAKKWWLKLRQLRRSHFSMAETHLANRQSDYRHLRRGNQTKTYLEMTVHRVQTSKSVLWKIIGGQREIFKGENCGNIIPGFYKQERPKNYHRNWSCIVCTRGWMGRKTNYIVYLREVRINSNYWGITLYHSSSQVCMNANAYQRSGR